MKVRAVLLVLAGAVVAAAACPGSVQPRPVIDPAGRRVEVPDRPARIVSLAPNVTEILFAVGAGDQVVGVTDFCDYPPPARSRARVGGYINPSLETVVALRPDLVAATVEGNREADVGSLERLGLPVVVIDTPDIDRLLGGIEFLADVTGHVSQGRAVVAALRRRAAAVEAAVGNRPRPRVLFLVGVNPLVAVGPGTFLDRLIIAAGGDNMLGASPVRYPLISGEQIIAADPGVIVVDVFGQNTAALERLDGWRDLKAVRGGRVHLLRDDTLLRPGPRIMEGLELLARLLHPDAFREGP